MEYIMTQNTIQTQLFLIRIDLLLKKLPKDILLLTFLLGKDPEFVSH